MNDDHGSNQRGNQTTDKSPWAFAGGRPNLLSVDQFTRDNTEYLFAIADGMQPIANRQKICRILEGAVLANLFFEASTRTRVSFGAAFCRLGGAVCDTTGFTFSSMAKGESIADTSRVISSYADAIVVRHPDQGAVGEFARAATIPVVNGGDGPGEHPTQALLDLYTIGQEFHAQGKSIDGCHIIMAGDLKYGRTVHSLAKLLALYHDIRFTFVAPESLQMPDDIIEKISVRGNSVRVLSAFPDNAHSTDIVYATRIQKERMAEDLAEDRHQEIQINKALVDRSFGPHTLIMHPLPRDSRPGSNDLSTDLDGDSRLAIFRQAACGIPIRMAIFAILFGIEHQIPAALRPPRWRLGA